MAITCGGGVSFTRAPLLGGPEVASTVLCSSDPHQRARAEKKRESHRHHNLCRSHCHQQPSNLSICKMSRLRSPGGNPRLDSKSSITVLNNLRGFNHNLGHPDLSLAEVFRRESVTFGGQAQGRGWQDLTQKY